MKSTLIVLLLFVVSLMAPAAQRVGLRDGWICVNDEPFFIKGVCFFENHSVTGSFQRSSLEIMDHEFRAIREAGFNTVLSQLRPEELALARKHGLMVIQCANHLFFSHEYLDPAEIERQVSKTREITEYSKAFDNILFYVIDNEPHVQDGIYRQGEDAIQAFYRTLANTVKETAPDALVAMKNYPPAAFVDLSMCEVLALNLYPNYPVWDLQGYADYIRHYHRLHGLSKPMVISEYGWTVDMGEKDFASVMLRTLEEQLDAGICGSVFYTWRTFGAEGVGDNLWFGIVPSQEEASAHRNPPRPLAKDLRKWFEAVIIQPRPNTFYSNRIPVRVYGSDRTTRMTATLGDATRPLKRKGRYWWLGEFPLTNHPSARTLTVTAYGASNTVLASKQIEIRRNPAKPTAHIVIKTKPCRRGDPFRATLSAKTGDGTPLPNVTIPFQINQTAINPFGMDSQTVTTDTNGNAAIHVPSPQPGYLSLLAGFGMEHPDYAITPAVEQVRIEP